MSRSLSTLLLIFLAFGWLLSACENTSDCSSKEAVTQLNVRFIKGAGSTLKNDTARVFIKKITVEGFPNAKFNTNQYVTGLTLSLNPNADTTHFIFDYSYKTKLAIDTISVSYRRNYELASINCNARINFSQIDTTATSQKLTLPFAFRNVKDNTIEIYVDAQ